MADETQNPAGSKINQNVNQAIYGLNIDNIPEQVKPGTLTYALNAMIDNFDGQMVTYQNEGSNVLCREFKTGYKVIGIHNITEQDRTVLFLVNPDTGDSEIGFLDNIVNCDYNNPTDLGEIKNLDYVNNGYNNIDPNVPCNCKVEDKKEILSFYELYQKNFPNRGNGAVVRDECCKYTTIINAKCLNFNINYPIHKAVHRIVGQNDDSVCGTEVYFTDGLNPRRYINLDDLPFKELLADCDRIKSNEVDCGVLDVAPAITAPCILPTQVSDGGSLIAGTYQFAIQYTNNKGEAYSAFYSVTNPISVFKQIYGLDYNFPTDKSIRLDISDLDTDFEFFNLAVIKTINGVPDVELVGTFNITGTTKTITYSGNTKTPINLTIEDIFEKFPYYETARQVAVVNNSLMWANLTSDKLINFQSVASLIQLRWETAQVPYTQFEAYNNGVNTALYRGYMRDEVYAFEICFLLRNGQQTAGFHIPGRTAVAGDLTPVSNNDVITVTNECDLDPTTQPKWKVYNTGSVLGTDPRYTAAVDKECYKGPYQYGEFGYHESEALYPCNKEVWGALADTPIRHHRMPDNIITHIYNSNPTPTNRNFEHKVYPLGIKVDLQNIKDAIIQSNLPDHIKSQIKGFKILRSDRVNNKTVIAKGLLYNVGAYSKGGTNYFYPNYPFNDLRPDTFISNSLSPVDHGSFSPLNGFGTEDSRVRFTFHSPDTHFYQPYLGNILKLETVENGIARGHHVPVKEHAQYRFLSVGAAATALVTGAALSLLFAIPKVTTEVGGNSGTTTNATTGTTPVGVVTGAAPGATATVVTPFPFTATGTGAYTGVTSNVQTQLPQLGEIAERGITFYKLFTDMFEKLIPFKNYAYQFDSVAQYNNFTGVPNTAFKQRQLDKALYLIPGVQDVTDKYIVNNYRRESSVYLKTPEAKILQFPNEFIGGYQDTSRWTLSDRGMCDTPTTVLNSNVSAFYGSIKRKLKDQYGEMYSYDALDTGYCGKMDINNDYTGLTDVVFGGDIFINRFGLKKKMPFFIDNMVGRPNETDVMYSQLGNIAYPTYWFNTDRPAIGGSGPLGFIEALFGVAANNFDCRGNNFFYQDGKMYLFAYGIPYFFVESEVNTDNRQAGNPTDKNFYPNVGNDIPDDWLQEITVPIVNDNHYIYNKTYSKQNKENYFYHLPVTFDPNEKCSNDFTHRIIYSDPNKWRINKPISYFELPKNHGRLTGIDAINNGEVLVRFENKSKIYNAMTAIQTSSGKYAYLGNDDVFNEGRAIDFGETDLGYGGSQNHLLLKTEAGHLFIDAKRSGIFLLNGRNIESLSDKMMGKWFNNNLPFNITKYYPNVNTDNHFNGIGITGVWDATFNRFIITKLDYEPKAEFKKDIEYREKYGKFYYKNQEILLHDPKYFCNRSWTMSYSPLTKSWISFHSYLPNFYIGQLHHFKSGINGSFNNSKSSVWNHNLIYTSFQTFYGKLEPYVLEYPFVFKYQDEILQNVKDYTTILEYYNHQDFYEINDDIYFNKAVLYNNQQCSGIRKLYPKPKGKLNLYFNYPKMNADSVDIMYTKSDNFFNYNQIWDVVKNANNHFPIWNESCVNKSIDKELNNDKFDYSTRSHQKTKLRAKNLRVRHIQDVYSRFKFVSKFVNSQTQTSEK